jgi:hypothetical protein
MSFPSVCRNSAVLVASLFKLAATATLTNVILQFWFLNAVVGEFDTIVDIPHRKRTSEQRQVDSRLNAFDTFA